MTDRRLSNFGIHSVPFWFRKLFLHWFADVQGFSMLLTGQFGIWHDITHFQTYPRALGPLSMWGIKSMAFGCVEFILLGQISWRQWSAIYRKFPLPHFRKRKLPQKKTDIVGVLRIFVEVPNVSLFLGWNLPAKPPSGSMGISWVPLLTRPKSGAVFLHLPRRSFWKNPWESCFASRKMIHNKKHSCDLKNPQQNK